jgi:DDE superfamily endonuclease/putative transposase ISC1217
LDKACWSIEEASMRLLNLVVRWWPQETLFLVGDDTFLARKGSKVFGAGMHRDGCLSTRNRAVRRWGHNWVVLCVLVESKRHPGRFYSLPVSAELYLNKPTAQKLGRKHRKKTEIMLDLVRRVERELPEQKLHFLGDYGYTAPAVLAQFPSRVEVTGRAHSSARLYEPAPPRHAGRGRPRIRGQRLPAPRELLDGGKQREFDVASGRRYRVRMASAKGCFYQAPRRLVQLVVLEHIGKRRENDVFFTTQSDASDEDVVRWYARRWSIEVMFRDAKQHLAVGREKNRTPRAAERTVPMGFFLYSLVVVWHETAAPAVVTGLRDYPGKRHPSFADMLAALRRDTLAEGRPKHLLTSPSSVDLQKRHDYLEKLLLLAA